MEYLRGDMKNSESKTRSRNVRCWNIEAEVEERRAERSVEHLTALYSAEAPDLSEARGCRIRTDDFTAAIRCAGN